MCGVVAFCCVSWEVTEDFGKTENEFHEFIKGYSRSKFLSEGKAEGKAN
jgi:Ser/Thr protein kinase RdoA (MazF antagonist)